MLSRLTHLGLVATALAPVLLTTAVALRHRPALVWAACAAAAALLSLGCAQLLVLARARLERLPFRAESIETEDRDVLAFLLAYLLPLIASEAAGLAIDLPSALAAFALIAFVVYQCELVHVNPVVGMLGWRFYKVTTPDHCTYLLLSRRDLASARATSTVVKLSSSLLMGVG